MIKRELSSYGVTLVNKFTSVAVLIDHNKLMHTLDDKIALL